jgi:hypothetical protein
MYCCSIVTCTSKDALDLVLHRIDEYEKLGIVSLLLVLHVSIF